MPEDKAIPMTMTTASRRAGAALAVVANAFVLLLSLVAAPARAEEPVQIASRQHNWFVGAVCLEIDHGRTYEGAYATVDPCSQDGAHQQWIARGVNDGDWVQLKVAHTGMCLAVSGGRHHDGARVVQTACEPTASATVATNQQWRFVYTAPGWYEVVARHSGKCLDKSSYDVVQWNCHGGSWQQWTRPY